MSNIFTRVRHRYSIRCTTFSASKLYYAYHKFTPLSSPRPLQPHVVMNESGSALCSTWYLCFRQGERVQFPVTQRETPASGLSTVPNAAPICVPRVRAALLAEAAPAARRQERVGQRVVQHLVLLHRYAIRPRQLLRSRRPGGGKRSLNLRNAVLGQRYFWAEAWRGHPFNDCFTAAVYCW